MTRLTALLARWETFLLLVLAATLIAGVETSHYFLTSSNLSIALAGAMPVSIVALPMTLVIFAGEIDISAGSTIGLCATIIALAIEAGLSAPLAMATGVAVGALAGLVNGVIVVFGALPSLVVTIGTLALYRGIAQILLKEHGVSDFPDWYQAIGFGTVGPTPIPWSVVIFLLFFAGFAVSLHRTRYGRVLYAIGNNRQAALFSGVNVGRVLIGVFVASGVMCSVAAIVLTAYLAALAPTRRSD